MIGHATIPFFILFVALTNLYLGYVTAVILGWGPAARRSVKLALVVRPPFAAASPTASSPAVVSTTAIAVAAPSPPSIETTADASVDGSESSGMDELAPELLAAIQSAIDQEP